MLKNHDLQYFIDYLRIFALSNKEKEITKEIVRLESISFGFDWVLEKDLNWQDILNKTTILTEIKSQEYASYIKCMKDEKKLSQESIKVSLPFTPESFSDNASIVIDFLNAKQIPYDIRISKKQRNDSFIIRVNKVSEAEEIITFVNENAFLKNNLCPSSPFVPMVFKVGVILDYQEPYHLIMSEAFAEYFQLKRKHHEVETASLKDFQKYLEILSDSIKEEDKETKNIYEVAAKALELKPEQYLELLKEKQFHHELNSREGREKIIEQAILETYDVYKNTFYIECALKLCVQGIYQTIPNRNDIRHRMEQISGEEIEKALCRIGKSDDLDEAIENVVGILIPNVKEKVVEKKEELSIDQIINHSVLMMYKKYQVKSTIAAFIKCIEDRDFLRITKEGNARALLSNVPFKKMEEYFLIHGKSTNLYEAIENYINQFLMELDLQQTTVMEQQK